MIDDETLMNLSCMIVFSAFLTAGDDIISLLTNPIYSGMRLSQDMQSSIIFAGLAVVVAVMLWVIIWIRQGD